MKHLNLEKHMITFTIRNDLRNQYFGKSRSVVISVTDKKVIQTTPLKERI
jgi:hypothetical protein